MLFAVSLYHRMQKFMERRFNMYSNIIFEDIFNYLEISSNELNISSIILKISSN